MIPASAPPKFACAPCCPGGADRGPRVPTPAAGWWGAGEAFSGSFLLRLPGGSARAPAGGSRERPGSGARVRPGGGALAGPGHAGMGAAGRRGPAGSGAAGTGPRATGRQGAGTGPGAGARSDGLGGEKLEKSCGCRGGGQRCPGSPSARPTCSFCRSRGLSPPCSLPRNSSRSCRAALGCAHGLACGHRGSLGERVDSCGTGDDRPCAVRGLLLWRPLTGHRCPPKEVRWSGAEGAKASRGEGTALLVRNATLAVTSS